MSTAATRILHLHLEKAGGTALRFALLEALGPGAKRFPHHHENRLPGIVPDEWDLISGHFAFRALAPLGGRLVTVLRDPVDRFISVYYYWRYLHEQGIEVSRKTTLAIRYALDDFVTIRDDVAIVEQFFNRMTWQLAEGAALSARQGPRAEGQTDSALLARATANLQACDVVGVQERMDAFAAAFSRRLALPLRIERLNVTAGRPTNVELSALTRRRILDWTYLDMELYQAACAIAAASAAPHRDAG